MNNFVVNLRAKTTEDLDLINFSQVERGVIKLKLPNDLELDGKCAGKFYINYSGLSLELHLEDNESVAIPFFTREVLTVTSNTKNELTLTKHNIKSPMQGTYGRLMFHGKSIIKTPMRLKKGMEFIHLVFRSKRYHELELSNQADGIQSSKVEVRVYIGDEFKPYNEGQAISRGLKIARDKSSKACEQGDKEIKFYRLSTVKMDDYLTDSGDLELDERLYHNDFSSFNL